MVVYILYIYHLGVEKIIKGAGIEDLERCKNFKFLQLQSFKIQLKIYTIVSSFIIFIFLISNLSSIIANLIIVLGVAKS